MTRLVLAFALLCACEVDSQVGSNALIAVDASAPHDGASAPACSDQKDNDDDERIDYPFDPGCSDRLGKSEITPTMLPHCSDGIDNDGDGVTDFPFEPGCEAASDDTETDPATPPACSDGVDNDNNGVRDFPDDLGCYSAGDPRESTVTT